MADAPSKRADADLRLYLRILARNKRSIIIIALTCVIASVVFSLTQPKRFDAEATLLLHAGAGSAAIGSGSGSTTLPVDRTPAVEMRILNGGALRTAVTERLGYKPDVSLSSTDPDKSAIVIISASASNAADSARKANDFVKAAVAVRRETIATDLKDSIANVEAESERLVQQLTEAQLRSQDLGRQIEAETDQRKRLELEFQKVQVDDELQRGTIATRLAGIRETSNQLRAALTANTTRGPYTIGLAIAPTAPSYPRPILNGLIALVTGLILGCAYAFGRNFFNDTMASKDELDEVTGGVTVLSLVPQVPEWKQRTDAILESVAHPSGAAAEAYRGLRTALDFAALDHKISLVQVTSSSAGEGKTTTAANLAVTIARADRRVILVDCDLRRPRLHEFFNLDNDRGFTSVLLGECTVTEALQRPDNAPNLLVLTSGPPPPNPSELLSTKAATDLLNALTQPADIVIVDSPPLLPVADATIIARYMHSTVLVVTANSTTKRSLERSLEMLEQIDAPLEGIVLNGLGTQEMYGGTYGYGYLDPRG
jgi:succinoglycan biosynthesis transport protein ExoP